MIAELASGIFQFFSGAFGKLFSFLGSILSALFGGLKDLLITLFTPIFQLIAAIFYFLYKVGLLLMTVIKLVFKFVYFFVYVMKGLLVTLIGLSYNGKTATLPARYQQVIDNIQPALDIIQLDKLATLCLWAIWIFIGIALIKIVGARE